jgi:hypothetical protein
VHRHKEADTSSHSSGILAGFRSQGLTYLRLNEFEGWTMGLRLGRLAAAFAARPADLVLEPSEQSWHSLACQNNRILPGTGGLLM